MKQWASYVIPTPACKVPGSLSMSLCKMIIYIALLLNKSQESDIVVKTR